jgi:hypothetical protein
VTVPPGAGHQITTRFAGLLQFSKIADLPVNGLKFSKVLNGVGPWSGSLSVEDPEVRKSAWVNATAPNLTSMWVDIDGVLLYGGRTMSRQYHLSQGKADLSGTDFCGYFAQRLQAQDYAAYVDPEGRAWASTGAPVLRMAYYTLSQALSKRFSIPVEIVAEGPTADAGYWITFSAPATQQQTLASLLSQFQELGYLTGIDYAQDVAYVNGRLTATVTLSYPRRGSEEGEPVTIELSHALDLEYDEDGTEQATRMVEQAGATEIRTRGEVWGPAQVAGYPLLETTVSHTALAPSEDTRAVLEAYVTGSLATRAFPLTAPVVTLPLFGEPSIFDLDVGMEVLLKSPTGEGDLPFNCPRFPNGLSERFRIVRIDVDVPDEGVPTMAIALNVPAFLTPVEPPEVTTTEPLTEAEAARKAAQTKAAAEETVSVEEAKEAEEEQAKAKAEAELLAQQEAEALAAQLAADQAAALAAGLTPAEVVKLSPKELHEKYGPLGPVGVVKLKKAVTRAAAEANHARELAEQAQGAAEVVINPFAEMSAGVPCGEWRGAGSSSAKLLMIFGLVGEGLYFRTRHGSIEGVKAGPFKADGTPMLFPLPNSAGEEVQFMIEGPGSAYTYADTPIF